MLNSHKHRVRAKIVIGEVFPGIKFFLPRHKTISNQSINQSMKQSRGIEAFRCSHNRVLCANCFKKLIEISSLNNKPIQQMCFAIHIFTILLISVIPCISLQNCRVFFHCIEFKEFLYPRMLVLIAIENSLLRLLWRMMLKNGSIYAGHSQCKSRMQYATE